MAQEKKLICGRKHVRVRCKACGEMVWTAYHSRIVCYVCDTCAEVNWQRTLGRDTPGLRSEKQYNG